MEYKFTNIGGNRQSTSGAHTGNQATGATTNSAATATGNGINTRNIVNPNVGLQEQQAAQRRMQRDGLAARDRLERQQRDLNTTQRQSTTNAHPSRHADRTQHGNRHVENRNNLTNTTTQNARQTNGQAQHAATETRREMQQFFQRAGQDRNLPQNARQTADHLARQLSHTNQHANQRPNHQLPNSNRISPNGVRHDANHVVTTGTRTTERASSTPSMRHEQTALRLLDTTLRRAFNNTNDARANAFEARANASLLSPNPNNSTERNIARTANEITGAWRLSNLFARLERAGAEHLVRQMEGRLAELISNPERTFTLSELIRDIGAGAFIPIGDGLEPFPLNGRARLVKEIIELMHTLDQIERALSAHGESILQDASKRRTTDSQEHGTSAQATHAEQNMEASDEEAAKSHGRASTMFEGEEFMLPSMPKRAAAFESARFLTAHGGALLDDAGNHLFVGRDGTPLKLDEMLWFAATGGSVSANESFDFANGTSPLLLYGFDSVYSAIGFDGRSLRQPHYIIVQSEANQAEREWAFGQPPLSVGWLRAVIERMKDSALASHNRLGETLEMALLDGSLHLAVIRGNVRQGAPEPDSFAIGGVLSPAAFSPAFA